MRVLTYNIRALRDDRSAVIRVITACRPDLVCLQEVSRFLGWRSRRAALAADTGLLLATGGRIGGLAVLYAPRVQVIATEHYELTRIPGLHRRALSVVVAEADARRLVVGCTHLDLVPEARRKHAEEIVTLLTEAGDAYGGKVVLAGDFNEGPDGAAWRRIAELYPDTCPAAGPTFPSHNPSRRIDTVFADPALPIRSAGIPPEPDPADLPAATDHLPVLTELA
ncbi:MAG: endonuclease/exonuclease/phosphatase [Streptosporangiales bacterium]|nr:endonuclease/exonuclease/phosphatase [Streptosporangiales bacterium]